MPACAMISCAPGCELDEALEAGRDRRQPAAGVDEDRYAAFGRECENGREPLVVEEELLGPRMELDAARAEVEAAPASSIGSSSSARRTNGMSRPSERAANSSVRSLPARKPG